MKNIMRSWVVRGLMVISLLTAPWAALAAYNLLQNENGSTGFLDSVSRTGIQAITFLRDGRVERTAGVNGTGVTTWSFDEKEYTMQIADLGTLGDASIVIPETGTIMEISVAWNQTLAGSNAVLTFFRIAQGGNFTNPTTITSASLTAPTTATGGGKVTDDIIFQSVNRGDVIAVQTDGGPSNAVPGFLTIRIRAPGAI